MAVAEVVYPTESDLRQWIWFLTNTNNALSRFLPICNDEWYDKILATIERVKVPYIQGTSSKAAHLFYYIIKDHNFSDGNKRSGIAVAYLFFLLNGCDIWAGDRIRFLAKKIAKSRGGANKDLWIKKIEKEFSYVCRPAAIAA